MLNIGIITDITWDNYILLHDKLRKIHSENYRIHAVYNTNIEIVSRCCNKNNLLLFRHSGQDISKIASTFLKTCDIWIIFSNLIEYLTLPQLIINKCDEYNIKYIIISEFSRDKDYYSFNINEMNEELIDVPATNDIDSVLSKLNDLDIDNQSRNNKKCFKDTLNKLKICGNKLNVKPFVEESYNLNFLKKQCSPLSLTPEIKTLIKNSYDTLDTIKRDKSIKLLYDKSEIKTEKSTKKITKELKQMNFANNRLNYYRQSSTQS